MSCAIELTRSVAVAPADYVESEEIQSLEPGTDSVMAEYSYAKCQCKAWADSLPTPRPLA